MKPWWVAAAALLLVSTLSSGCLTESGSLDKDAVLPAPVWNAGYSWTYATHSEGLEVATGDRNEFHSNVTLRVFNTQAPLDGKPVYYVVANGSGANALGQMSIGDAKGVTAYSKDSLTPAGFWYSWERHVYREGPGCNTTKIELQDLHYVEIDPDEAFPRHPFPLTTGTSANGTLGFGDEDPLVYTVSVGHLQKIDVPAGTFRAVPVRFSLTIEEDDEHGTFSAEYWYSPEARYFVRITQESSFVEEDEDFGGEFSYKTTSELTSYALTEAAEEPAPVARDDDDLFMTPISFFEWSRFRIVSNASLPFNVAEGAREVTVGLQKDPDAPWAQFDEPVAKVDEVSADFGFDPERYTVHWTLSAGVFGKEIAASDGPTATFMIDGPGKFEVEAKITDKCTGSHRGDARATVSAYWERSFPVSLESGTPKVVDVARVHVPYEDTNAEASWTWQRTYTAPGVDDDGVAQLVDNKGQVQSHAQDSDTVVARNLAPGFWTVRWDQGGVDPVGVYAVGDDVIVTVRIEAE